MPRVRSTPAPLLHMRGWLQEWRTTGPDGRHSGSTKLTFRGIDGGPRWLTIDGEGRWWADSVVAKDLSERGTTGPVDLVLTIAVPRCRCGLPTDQFGSHKEACRDHPEVQRLRGMLNDEHRKQETLKAKLEAAERSKGRLQVCLDEERRVTKNALDERENFRRPFHVADGEARRFEQALKQSEEDLCRARAQLVEQNSAVATTGRIRQQRDNAERRVEELELMVADAKRGEEMLQRNTIRLIDERNAARHECEVAKADAGNARKNHATMFDNLTSVQQRCTALLDEVRDGRKMEAELREECARLKRQAAEALDLRAGVETKARMAALEKALAAWNSGVPGSYVDWLTDRIEECREECGAAAKWKFYFSTSMYRFGRDMEGTRHDRPGAHHRPQAHHAERDAVHYTRGGHGARESQARNPRLRPGVRRKRVAPRGRRDAHCHHVPPLRPPAP